MGDNITQPNENALSQPLVVELNFLIVFESGINRHYCKILKYEHYLNC